MISNTSVTTFRFTLTILIIHTSALLSAQTVIPNNGFENWMNGNPTDWTTNNSGNYITITKVNDPNEGQFALKGTVIQGQGTIAQPPMLQSSSGNYGFPADDAFTELSLWYKTFLYGGDRFNINIYLYNSSNVMVGGGSASIGTSTSAYTFITVPVVQFTQGAATALITFTLADGSGMTNGHIQSWFIIDELTCPGMSFLAAQPVSANNIELSFSGKEFVINAETPSSYKLKVISLSGQQLFEISKDIYSTGQASIEYFSKEIQDQWIIVQLFANGVMVLTKRLFIYGP